jgi:hypothetical protein
MFAFGPCKQANVSYSQENEEMATVAKNSAREELENFRISEGIFQTIWLMLKVVRQLMVDEQSVGLQGEEQCCHGLNVSDYYWFRDR